MKRPALLLLSLVATGTVAWVTVFGSSGPTRAPRSAQGGKPPVAAPPRRPTRVRLEGDVLTKDGLGLGGATVFVLPKQRPGIERDEADLEVTDERGHWWLRTPRTVGCWIGVVAPGYRCTWLDGDVVDPAVQMVLVVEPAPPVVVTVRDAEGRPLPDQGVQLEAWPPGPTWFLPGPGARPPEQWEVTDARGRAVFRVIMPGPVSVLVHVDGAHTDPPSGWLPDAVGALEFDAHPNTGLDVALHDEQSGAPLSGLVTAEFLDPGTGRAVFSCSETTHEEGRLRVERAVPPGRYHVRLEMDGRAPWLATDVEAQHAPGALVLDARLAPAAEPATLVVELTGNEGARVQEGARRRAPLSFLRRSDGPWARRGWIPGAPERWDAARETLEFALPPGTWQVLVADVITGRASLEPAVELAAGMRHALRADMRPGQRGRLPSLTKEVTDVLDLDVAAEGWARLPVYGGTPGGRARMARPLDVIRGALQGREVWLGPYPFDEFRLVLRRYGGGEVVRSYP